MAFLCCVVETGGCSCLPESMRSCKTNVEEFNKLWQVPDEDGYRKRNLYEDVVQVSTTASADMEVGSNGTCYPPCMYSKEPSKY